MIPLQLFELLFVVHAAPGSNIAGAAVTVLFALVYTSWTLVVASRGGFWIYPVLGQLNPPWRCVPDIAIKSERRVLIIQSCLQQ